MVVFTFLKNNGKLAGFRVKGHAGANSIGKDIVCAAVSSSAYMAANTLTDVVGAQLKTDIKEGFMQCILKNESDEKTSIVLEGLKLHIHALSKLYPNNIKVVYGGVLNA